MCLVRCSDNRWRHRYAGDTSKPSSKITKHHERCSQFHDHNSDPPRLSIASSTTRYYEGGSVPPTALKRVFGKTYLVLRSPSRSKPVTKPRPSLVEVKVPSGGRHGAPMKKEINDTKWALISSSMAFPIHVPSGVTTPSRFGERRASLTRS